jgi:putative membrane protein
MRMIDPILGFDLPLMNATLNGVSGVFLFIGWLLIRSNRTRPHIVMMSCALVSSTIFLVGYVTNHILRHGLVTHFTAQGPIRPFYFTLLISHTFLAVVTVPMVICTVIPALKARYDKHRRIARWTFPIWMYVSVTGVIVYMMLYRWYPPGTP